jgi:hypothetical protein
MGAGLNASHPVHYPAFLNKEGWVDGFKMVQFKMIEDFHELFESLQQGRTKDKT